MSAHFVCDKAECEYAELFNIYVMSKSSSMLGLALEVLSLTPLFRISLTWR